jgi:hypothetical protein
MNRVAIAFSTKDRVELSRRTVEPLLQSDKFDLFWMDGSDTEEGRFCPHEVYEHTPIAHTRIHVNVRGGADAAIVYSLTTLYDAGYDYIGLVENDVLLTDPNWFDRTMALFEQGDRDGLKVGAVSARCFEDRILIQRPDYAIMHNLGAGMVIFTREAAVLVLKYFRTGYTHANRLLFSQMSGVDIGGWWAFRGGQHILCADWSFDAVLAAHGLCSLALTPSPVEMIGQVPPLAEQGLALARGPVAERVNDEAFAYYQRLQLLVREGTLKPAWPGLFNDDGSATTIYPHQLPYVGGIYSGDWALKWMMGFGPFAWRAGEQRPSFTVPILGPCDLYVGGGPFGGKVQVVDTQSGFEATPNLQAEGSDTQILALNIPGSCGYRPIKVTMLSPGTTFYGIKVREHQPYNPTLRFDHSWLPPTG